MALVGRAFSLQLSEFAPNVLERFIKTPYNGDRCVFNLSLKIEMDSYSDEANVV